MVDSGKTEALEGILKEFSGLERGTGVEIGVKKINGNITNSFGRPLQCTIYAKLPTDSACFSMLVPQSEVTKTYDTLANGLKEKGLEIVKGIYEA